MSQRKPIPEDIGEHLKLMPDGSIIRTTNPVRGRITKGKRVDTLNTQSGYMQLRLGNNMYRAHRIVWFLHYGEQPPKYIDHINGDRTDNRPENLREACHHTNLANAKRKSNNTSGVKGVQRSGNKWIGSVGFKGERHYVGPFTDIAEAEIAVRQLREQLHGDFTNHG